MPSGARRLLVGVCSETAAGVPAPAAAGDAPAPDGGELYWAGSESATYQPLFPGWTGRTDLDGLLVERRLLEAVPPSEQRSWDIAGLAVGAGHLYWDASVLSGAPGSFPIERTSLSGRGVDTRLVTVARTNAGVTVGDDHLWWAEEDTIGWANLDGTGVVRSFMTGAYASRLAAGA